MSFARWLEDGKVVPWANLRHWLCDLASELWQAATDQTLPEELSLDHVWITAAGAGRPAGPTVASRQSPAPPISARDLSWPTALPERGGRVRGFDDPAAACATRVTESGSRENLKKSSRSDRRPARPSLEKPVEISKGIRAGSVFMLPVYVSIMVFLGSYQPEGADQGVGAVQGRPDCDHRGSGCTHGDSIVRNPVSHDLQPRHLPVGGRRRARITCEPRAAPAPMGHRLAATASSVSGPVGQESRTSDASASNSCCSVVDRRRGLRGIPPASWPAGLLGGHSSCPALSAILPDWKAPLDGASPEGRIGMYLQQARQRLRTLTW